MLALFSDEQIVTQSTDNTTTLTTHRLCYEHREWGRSYNQSIMLEHITSCENYASSQVIFIVISVACLFFGFLAGAGGNPSALIVMTVIALVVGAMYFITKASYITIASPSTKMKIKVNGMKSEQVMDFINKVEQTKHRRLLSLNGRPGAMA
jgi:hypothetical protein